MLTDSFWYMNMLVLLDKQMKFQLFGRKVEISFIYFIVKQIKFNK